MLPSNFKPQADAVVLNKVLPVGTILPYSSDSLPTDGKFLPCDGSEVLGTAFPELSALISGKYGTATTSSKFKLPNLNGKVPVGTGDNYFGTGIGQTGGQCVATCSGSTAGYALKICQMPAHSHTLYGNDGSTDNQTKAPRLRKDDAESAAAADTIGPTGGGQAHYHGFSFSTDIVQPYLTAEYIIKAIPDEVIQYNPNITAGLSALNGVGQQTTSIDLSTTEIGLNVTDEFSYTGAGSLQIANCSIMPDKLSQGAPRWNENYTLTTGNIFTKGESLNVNYWGTGDRYAYVDFHAQGTAPQGTTQGTTYDYDARLNRYPGLDGKFELTNKGTGPITVDRTIDQINTNNKSIVTKEYVDANLPDIPAFYGVMVSNDATRTTPAQMRADRANANFYGAWDVYSKGEINTGANNSQYPSTNSLMYTMHVNVLQNTVVTMYNFNNDDYFYIYQDDVLKYTGSNYVAGVPRVVTFGLTAGIRRIDIVKNDSGYGSNSFELMGNIIGTNVRFIS